MSLLTTLDKVLDTSYEVSKIVIVGCLSAVAGAIYVESKS